MEYPELEWTHEDHQGQLLAPHNTTLKSDCTSESPGVSWILFSVLNQLLGEEPFPDIELEPPMTDHNQWFLSSFVNNCYVHKP